MTPQDEAKYNLSNVHKRVKDYSMHNNTSSLCIVNSIDRKQLPKIKFKLPELKPFLKITK